MGTKRASTDSSDERDTNIYKRNKESPEGGPKSALNFRSGTRNSRIKTKNMEGIIIKDIRMYLLSTYYIPDTGNS